MVTKELKICFSLNDSNYTFLFSFIVIGDVRGQGFMLGFPALKSLHS
jgi:hypothetical protein